MRQNRQEFGLPGAGRGQAAYAQVRLTAAGGSGHQGCLCLVSRPVAGIGSRADRGVARPFELRDAAACVTGYQDHSPRRPESAVMGVRSERVHGPAIRAAVALHPYRLTAAIEPPGDIAMATRSPPPAHQTALRSRAGVVLPLFLHTLDINSQMEYQVGVLFVGVADLSMHLGQLPLFFWSVYYDAFPRASN